MKTISTILTIAAVSTSIFFFTPSEHTVTHDVTVHNGSTINQMVVDAAKAEGINLDNVDINDSRDLTIHQGDLDAGNLRPGTQVKVVVVYRK